MNYANCDPLAEIVESNEATGTGATGLGCNNVCDPLTDRKCEPTQTVPKDF
eukprot:SAG31_NODE_23466_length_503_cov_9.037129_2_plen_50_part_01